MHITHRHILSGAIMKTGTLISLLALTVLGTACGEAIDINRVAPNVVDKSVFSGEWYARGLVVDKQFNTFNTFVGAEGSLERIKWEITESRLIGYRSYEKVPGSDPSNPGEQNVIIAFPIQRHFDVRRQYNALNGVESNVIEENDYDRPWWERQYIRVDWSNQAADTYDIVEQSFTGNKTGINRNSNQIPNYPWKVRIGDQLVGDRIISEGDTIETTIDGSLAADPYVCYYLDGLSPCNGTQVKVKFSFKRVPQNNDYQAFDYPDYVPQQTGGLVLAQTGDAVLTSTSNALVDSGEAAIQRLCTPAEMDRDGSATMKVKDETYGVRLCNTDRQFGDDLDTCRDALVRCDAEEGSDLVAITPNNNPICDPNHHSPDDCVQLTTSVFSRFGYFRTDRFAVDRENGTQYNARERLINRHNLWAKSTDDSTGRPLPMGRRPVQQIVYTLNVGFPSDLLELTQVDLANDWNTAFMGAVASARGLDGAHQLPANLNEGFAGFPEVTRIFEIRQNSCNIAAAKAFADKYDMNDVLSQNGVDTIAFGNLEESCAVLEFESQRRIRAGDDLPAFTWEQLGDLRYNFLNWASKAELAGPLGYGPSASDPITGEIISANANMYGASVDTYANWGADIVQLLNGDIETSDIINGTVSREHVEAVRNRWASTNSAERVNAFMTLFDSRASGMSDSTYFTPVPVTALNRGMEKLRDSGVEEDFLIDTETVRLFGKDPTGTVAGQFSSQALENARPSNWSREHIPDQMIVAANARAVGSVRDQGFESSAKLGSAGRYEELVDYLGRRNYCFLGGQVEPAIADLASRIKTEGLNREQIVKLIRASVFRGVTAHELGHTFGLRHNFEGSADAMNYFPQYWGVGAEGLPEGKEHLLGAGLTNQYEVQYSSIMDYHQRFNSDFAGIGLYDKAAIKLGYAETVEIFDEDDGAFVARDWIGQTFLLDPKDFPSLVSGAAADTVIDGLFDDAYEQALEGDSTALMDIAGNNDNAALLPRPENLFKRKDIPLRDWYRQQLLISRFTGGLDESECSNFGLPNQPGCMDVILAQNGLADDDGKMPKVAVPYSFCGDEFAFGGNLTCNRYDLGPTSSEIVKNAGEMYEFYYPFDAFRRDRVLNPFTSWADGYMNRLFSRTYQPMLNAYRFFYYYRRAQTLRVYPTIRDWGNAALQGMDFFVRVLQQPEPGEYCKENGTWILAASADPANCTTGNTASIGLDQGRIFNSTWDSEYDFRPINIGNYWDKALAIQAITSSDAFFFRDFSQETNRGAFSIGYYRIFQNEMLDLFSGLMRDDTSVFAPRLFDSDNDGQPEVFFQPFLKTGIYGEPLDQDPNALAGDPIRPATSYQLRNWATIFGIINMTSTLDQTLDFATRTRITLAGQPGEAVINTDPNGDGIQDIEIAEFTDPLTHLAYRSVAFDDADHSIGVQMLQEASDFVAGPWQDAQDALATANAGVDEAAKRAARIGVQRADAKLNEKVQVIDFNVYLGDIFQFPGG